MITRALALAGAGLAAAALIAAAQPAAGAAERDSGRLEVYAAPGVGYEDVAMSDGCHTFERKRSVGFSDAEPIATYAFYSGPDCSGSVLGSGRDDTQWVPPLNNVESVRIDFE